MEHRGPIAASPADRPDEGLDQAGESLSLISGFRFGGLYREKQEVRSKPSQPSWMGRRMNFQATQACGPGMSSFLGKSAHSARSPTCGCWSLMRRTGVAIL